MLAAMEDITVLVLETILVVESLETMAGHERELEDGKLEHKYLVLGGLAT